MTSPALLGLAASLSFLSDGDRNDGGDSPSARGYVGDSATDGRVVEYVGEVRPQLLYAHLFSHANYGTPGNTGVH